MKYRTIMKCFFFFNLKFVHYFFMIIIFDLFFISGVGLSKEERTVVVIQEIIQELLKAHDDGKDVNLNSMKSRISSKYGLDSSPKLVDIIAAVPYDAKKILLPKLKAKPIRTASGVRF